MPKLLLVLLLLEEEECGAEVLVSVAVVAHRPVDLHKRWHNHTEAEPKNVLSCERRSSEVCQHEHVLSGIRGSPGV